MGTVSLAGASIAVALVMLACGSSNDTATGTSAAGGSSGAVGSGGTAGGGTGTGGSTGSGGVSMGGAGGGVSQSKASIEFVIVAPGSFCKTSVCGNAQFIGITDASGKGLTLTMGCGSVSCDTCTSACPENACPYAGVAVNGAHFDWDGSYYATSTCAGPQGQMSCLERATAKSGTYTAGFCATPGKLVGPDGGVRQCHVSDQPKCGSVEFEFPSSTVAKGTVGP